MTRRARDDPQPAIAASDRAARSRRSPPVLRLQRAAGNRAVSQMVQRAVLARDTAQAVDPAGQDAASIIHHHLRTWYDNTHFALDKADLSGDSDAVKWFLAALGGNLAWALTAFLNPAVLADAAMIKLLSMAGATIGSGTLQQLHDNHSEVDLRQMLVTDLSAKMSAMETSPELVDRVNDEFTRQGVASPQNSKQTLERYKIAWGVMFGNRVPYADDAAIEGSARRDAEAISAAFWKRYKALQRLLRRAPRSYLREHYPDLPITSRGHRIPLDEADRNWPMYVQGLYYLAIVDSGVVDQMPEVAQPSNLLGLEYDFPGEVTILLERLGDPTERGFRDDDPLAGIDVYVPGPGGKSHALEPGSP